MQAKREWTNCNKATGRGKDKCENEGELGQTFAQGSTSKPARKKADAAFPLWYYRRQRGHHHGPRVWERVSRPNPRAFPPLGPVPAPGKAYAAYSRSGIHDLLRAFSRTRSS